MGRIAGLTLVAVGAMVAMVVPPATAAPRPLRAVAPTDTKVADAALAAQSTARLTGRPVEVPALRTPYNQVYAQPNGTMRADISTTPTQVARGSKWVPVDTTLHRSAD